MTIATTTLFSQKNFKKSEETEVQLRAFNFCSYFPSLPIISLKLLPNLFFCKTKNRKQLRLYILKGVSYDSLLNLERPFTFVVSNHLQSSLLLGFATSPNLFSFTLIEFTENIEYSVNQFMSREENQKSNCIMVHRKYTILVCTENSKSSFSKLTGHSNSNITNASTCTC